MSKVRRRLILVGAVGLLVGAAVAGQTETRDDNAYRQLKRFSEVLNRIHSDYVDETNMEDLMDAAIRGMLQSLDPHSQYLDRKQYSDLMVGTQGSFGGLGIVISIRDDVLTVIAPIEGTPASRMGIQGGDQILFIDGESTEGFTADDAVNRLRGPEGTQVTIKIRREGEEELLEYTITRDIIKLKSVPYKFISDDRIGYVRLSQFSKTTGSELEHVLDSLETAGIQGLIIDLRSNPGGLLDQAVEVSDIFLDRDQLITYTKGRRKSADNRFLDTSNSHFRNVPLIVLVDEHSASASEIVSGAIQDWDRGLVVGQTTFGKGSVQSVIPLDEETGLKLTTAKYYTPSGRCIQRDEFNRKARDAEGPGGAAKADSLAPKEVFYTNAKRPVYGGGGITPDIEIDQRKMEAVEAKIERRGLFFSFAVEYFPYHPITRNWAVTPETVDQFREFLKKREVDYTPEEWAASEKYVKNGIKRELFRKAFGDEAAYEVLAETDTQLQQTFDLFRKAQNLDALFALSNEWRLQKERESAVAGTGAQADSLEMSVRGDVQRE